MTPLTTSAIPFADLDNSDAGRMEQDHGHEPDGADASDQGGSPHHEGAGAWPHRQHRLGRRPVPYRLFHRLCGIEGGADSSDALHGGGAGARDAGQLRGTGSAGRHPRDRAQGSRRFRIPQRVRS